MTLWSLTGPQTCLGSVRLCENGMWQVLAVQRDKASSPIKSSVQQGPVAISKSCSARVNPWHLEVRVLSAEEFHGP